jgi:hypothetical protein
MPKTRSGGFTSAEATSQTQQAINAAHVILANCGVGMSPSKVSRLVRQFEARVARNGWTLFEFLTNAVQLSADQRRAALANPDVARVISYVDPTGETAVNNVLRQQDRPLQAGRGQAPRLPGDPARCRPCLCQSPNLEGARRHDDERKTGPHT